MTRGDIVNPVPRVLLSLFNHTFLCLALVLSGLALSSPTQAGTVITQTTGAGDLGTHVLLPLGHVYGITDGKPVGDNLYHSFAQFNVGTGDIAQFQTGTPFPNTSVHNILGRVTGNSPSAIFGTIDSATYYPTANFFLLNPNGIIFGPNATLNIGGTTHFTTADYLKLADGQLFKAMPDLAADALLSTFAVAAFGFSGLSPAAITVQGSHLTVANGTGLSLVGGNRGFTYTNPDTDATPTVPGGMTITGGKLSAPGGQINIASVASAGDISASDFMPTSGMAMGNIALSQGAIVDVSGDGGGTVRIRGGQFVMDSANLTANSTGNATGAAIAISIETAGDLTLSNQSSIFVACGSAQHGAEGVECFAAHRIRPGERAARDFRRARPSLFGRGLAGALRQRGMDQFKPGA